MIIDDAVEEIIDAILATGEQSDHFHRPHKQDDEERIFFFGFFEDDVDKIQNAAQAPNAQALSSMIDIDLMNRARE